LKTQQADSPGSNAGKDAALRRPRTAQRALPTVWLNLVCLDAPLVAVAWLWLFARSFAVELQIGNAMALFLTAWLIYLADRLADASSLPGSLPRSLRQDFCLRHREIWITTVALVVGFDAYVIWRTTALQTFFAGAAVGLLAVIYLVVNHPLGLVWRSLPAKEVAIGILFAAGTVVALLPHLPGTASFAFAVCAFAALCSLNCISIAGWERELDRAQGKVSLVTRHPGVADQSAKICIALALLCFVSATFFKRSASVVHCVSASALLLAWLNVARIGRDQRTAFADLVLLTPVVPLLALAL
jgi:hypothetical protein